MLFIFKLLPISIVFAARSFARYNKSQLRSNLLLPHGDEHDPLYCVIFKRNYRR